jgi:DNA-binding winged helix-turn-helix (wHTH) protein/Tol biopolymer transport system component
MSDERHGPDSPPSEKTESRLAHATRIVAFEFGPFRVDLSTRQLSRDGETIPLTPKAFDVLVALIRNRGSVISKEGLLATVWPNAFVTDDSLTQNIWAIRRALGEDSAQPIYVSTLPRVGYRFIAQASEVAEPEHKPADPTDDGQDTRESVDRRALGLSGRGVAALVAACLLGALAGGVLARAMAHGARTESITVPVVFTQPAPAGTVLVPGIALSPDGRALALVAQDLKTRRSSLWLRDLGSGDVRALTGTEGAEQPFWSPRSTAIGFFADGQLKTLDLLGSNVQTIATVGVLPQGASWSTKDTIIFAGWRSALYAVPAAGGTVTPLTKLNRAAAERWHRHPVFLPDGQHYAYVVSAGKDDASGVYIGVIGTDTRTRVFDASVVAVQFAPPYRLLGLRGETLIEGHLDKTFAQTIGVTTKLEGRLVPPGFRARGGFSVSGAGLIAFGGASNDERLMTFSRHGDVERVLSARSTINPALSPDGGQIATSASEQAGVWLVDLDRDVSTRVVAEGAAPAWSPDGTQLAFSSSRRAGVGDIYIRRISGGSQDELLLQTPELKMINDWSRDGKYIVFTSTNSELKQDLWLLPMAGGSRTPIPYLRTGFSQIQAQVSPDGRWLAYTSDESGRWEVYVQSFPTPGTKKIISVGGGGEPKWSATGHELFYVRSDMSLMSVQIPSGNPVDGFKMPQPLFRVPVMGDTSAYRSRYAVHSGGDRFVFNALDESSQTPITVVVNWENH